MSKQRASSIACFIKEYLIKIAREILDQIGSIHPVATDVIIDIHIMNNLQPERLGVHLCDGGHVMNGRMVNPEYGVGIFTTFNQRDKGVSHVLEIIKITVVHLHPLVKLRYSVSEGFNCSLLRDDTTPCTH